MPQTTAGISYRIALKDSFAPVPPFPPFLIIRPYMIMLLAKNNLIINLPTAATGN
jgi:hypothetical protein